MNRNFLLLPTLAVTSFLAFSLPNASALSYTISSGSVVADTSEPGLVIQNQLDGSLAGNIFSLVDGQSIDINFFTIWTNELGADADDLVPSPITATLQFSPVTQVIIGGTTFATITPSGFQLLAQGNVMWVNPAPIVLADRIFTVQLNDTSFNSGINTGVARFSPGAAKGALIKATITQISSTASVPDNGSTVVLLGIGFVVLVLGGRRRSAAR